MKFDSAIFYTHNLKKSISFYSELLGLKLEQKQGEYYASFVFDNDAKLGIKVADTEREVPGKQTVILSTDRIDTIYEELKKKDIQLYSVITEYAWGRHFSVLDPDGNKVEFVQR